MKKAKRLLIVILLICMCLVNINVKAESTAPATITYSLTQIDESLYMSGVTPYILNTGIKKVSNDKYAYCLVAADSASGNTTYTRKSKIDNAAISYILENEGKVRTQFGEPKGYLTSTMAIWYILGDQKSSFFDEYFEDSNGNLTGKYLGNGCANSNSEACNSSDEIAAKLKELVDNAKKYKVTAPTINPSLKSSVLKLSSDKNFYESEKLGVITTGVILDSNNKSEYTVSLSDAPAGTIVTDISGAEKTTFGISEKYMVKVPVESVGDSLDLSFNVQISSTGKTNEVWRYESSQGIQPVALLYPNYSPLSTSMTLTLTQTTTEFSKKDATTGKELPGATLQILDENKNEIKDLQGNVLYKWVSTDQPHIITGLPAGKYYLRETIAPEGYKLNQTEVLFEVKNDGTVTKVEMKNEAETVDVPDTKMKKSIIYSIISIVLLATGGSLIYLIVKKRKLG